MNWLAHIVLSENRIEYQLGNLLADRLKGKSWPGASPQFNEGLVMHRIIDRFTDHHPCVMRSRGRLGQQGLLRGVVIDIVYDHLLAKHWNSYAKMSFNSFIDQFNTQAMATITHYPSEVASFLSRLITSGHLKRYQDFRGVDEALSRVDQRLSLRVLSRESCHEYLPQIKQELSMIEGDFTCFMPDLIAHFKSAFGDLRGDHWLI